MKKILRTPEELWARFAEEPWYDHSPARRIHWRREVAKLTTSLGYPEWAVKECFGNDTPLKWDVLLEFAQDVELADPSKVKHEGPDLHVNYVNACRVLGKEPK